MHTSMYAAPRSHASNELHIKAIKLLQQPQSDGARRRFKNETLLGGNGR